METSGLPLSLSIYTPTRCLLMAHCESVSMPTTMGEIEVLPGHVSLVTLLGTGIVHYDHENSTGFISVSGGFTEVKNNTVTLFVDMAELSDEVDVSRAEKSLARALERLVNVKKDDVLDYNRALASEARARTRLELTRHKISKS